MSEVVAEREEEPIELSDCDAFLAVEVDAILDNQVIFGHDHQNSQGRLPSHYLHVPCLQVQPFQLTHLLLRNTLVLSSLHVVAQEEQFVVLRTIGQHVDVLFLYADRVEVGVFHLQVEGDDLVILGARQVQVHCVDFGDFAVVLVEYVDSDSVVLVDEDEEDVVVYGLGGLAQVVVVMAGELGGEGMGHHHISPV